MQANVYLCIALELRWLCWHGIEIEIDDVISRCYSIKSFRIIFMQESTARNATAIHTNIAQKSWIEYEKISKRLLVSRSWPNRFKSNLGRKDPVISAVLVIKINSIRIVIQSLDFVLISAIHTFAGSTARIRDISRRSCGNQCQPTDMYFRLFSSARH